MTDKADFNAEEWQTVVDGPLYAGVCLSAANRGGTLREGLEMNRVYAEARQAHGALPLLDAIVASPPTISIQSLQSSGGDISEATVGQLRRAMRILERLATAQEQDAYKTFVMTVAQRVAGAHKEGGFLGIGGQAISDAENAALDEISMALGSPPAEFAPREIDPAPED